MADGGARRWTWTTLAAVGVAAIVLAAMPAVQATTRVPTSGGVPSWLAVPTWNPCTSVTWSANSAGMPRGDLVQAKAAMRMIGKASGLDLVFAGTDVAADITILYHDKWFWGGDATTTGRNHNEAGEDGFASLSTVTIDTDSLLRRTKAEIRWQYLSLLSTAAGVEDLQGGMPFGDVNTGRLTKKDLAFFRAAYPRPFTCPAPVPVPVPAPVPASAGPA